MKSKFGFLAQLGFLQTFVSKVISNLNPAVIHNIEKYIALKKVSYLTSIESIDGDYLEFGVFRGSSFSHSIRSWNRHKHLSDNKTMNFFGFDSFEGFGKLEESELHSFYTNENFSSDYNKVFKKIKRGSKGLTFKLIKGFFEKTLANGPKEYGIEKAKIIFIDSDTYSSANYAFNFCKDIVQEGTYIILDDFFSYRGSMKKGVARAFSDFKNNTKICTRHVMNYGNGGSVFVVSSI